LTLSLRTRRQTRAALLGHLLTSGDCFRGELVERLGLTEASISRIVAELRSEGLVSEYAKRPAPYPGGPTNVVAINRSIPVAALELSNGRVSAGIGSLDGAMACAHRVELSSDAGSAEVERAVETVLQELGKWARKEGVTVRQVALSLPGFGALGDINPIIPVEVKNLTALVGERFAGVPIAVTNSVQAHAAMHGFGIHAKAMDSEHLFVYVGHGIGAARIGDIARGAAHRPVEIGHMVMQSGGPRCRCGHQGCLEAYAALPVLAAVFGITEAQLLADGDHLFENRPLTQATWPRVEDMLRRIGQALGNALNVDPMGNVVLAGWPSLLAPPLRQALLDGLDASILGGIERRGVKLVFIPPSIGNDPMPTLSYAAFAYVQRGAIEADRSDGTDSTSASGRPSAT
jgi:predicted NBD/HSP70 family sugar kinase